MIEKTVQETVDEINKSVVSSISFDEFCKADIRVGIILEAEKVPKKDRLLKLKVDLGSLGERTIVAGVAEHYTAKELAPVSIGDYEGSGPNPQYFVTTTHTRILVVTNLEPRKVGGIESHGMLLAAKDEATGKLVLATCPDMPAGTKIG
jgi:methionyl-tRNA synthetase